MNSLIGITTFRKFAGLEKNIRSLHKHGYLDLADLVVADDDNGSSKEQVIALAKELGIKIKYVTGPRGGVWKNKNRCINQFLINQKYETILLLDDDLEFTAPGLLELLEKAGLEGHQKHITTYLGNYKDHLSRKGFFETFPVILKDNNLSWCGGSQGVGLWAKRDAVVKVGFFKPFPYIYGYEHDEWSNRLLRVQGYTPQVKPILTRSVNYFTCGATPNNYALDNAKIDGPQSKKYWEYYALTIKGLELKQQLSSLDPKKEKVTEI